MLDFKSMQRGSLFEESILEGSFMPPGFSKLSSGKRMLANIFVTNTTTSTKNLTNNTSVFSRVISGFTGFVDGSFNAKNITNCRNSLFLFVASLQNMSTAINNNDENNTVYYSTRALKYFHPSAFACYYSGKETYETYVQYSEINNPKDVSYNAMYKTGQMTDQVRIMLAMINKGTYFDREVYVLFRAIGTIFNIVLSPYLPRREY